MSTMRPPIVLMVIHIRGLAALKMEKDKKKKIIHLESPKTENEERILIQNDI